MSKYDGSTPGPWSQDTVGTDEGIIIRRGRTRVAEVRFTAGEMIEREIADARLICDAPMLLAQRNELLAALEHISKADGSSWNYDELIARVKATL